MGWPGGSDLPSGSLGWDGVLCGAGPAPWMRPGRLEWSQVRQLRKKC